MSGLKIMKTAEGTARGTWYARVTRNGQKVNINLKVPVRGTIPTDKNGNFKVITSEIASAWFEDLKGSYAWETVKNQTSLLSGAFRRWTTNGEPNYADITADTGRHKGQSTQDLQAVEELTGCRIRPGDRYAGSRKTGLTTRDLIKKIHGRGRSAARRTSA